MDDAVTYCGQPVLIPVILQKFSEVCDRAVVPQAGAVFPGMLAERFTGIIACDEVRPGVEAFDLAAQLQFGFGSLIGEQ
jgi:hypothetical protein